MQLEYRRHLLSGLPTGRACRCPHERNARSTMIGAPALPRLARRGSSPTAAPPDWGPLEPLLFDAHSPGRGARTNELVPSSERGERGGARAAPGVVRPERQYSPGSAGNRYFQRRGLVKAVEPPMIDVVEFSPKHLGGRACRMTKRMLLQARREYSKSRLGSGRRLTH